MKQALHDIIFEAETKAGRRFDILLIACIISSVLIVMLDSVALFNARYGDIFYALEWGFTGSIYWAIVTLTTVGYGDIAPATNIGQFLAAVIMLMGYGIIAVPAGIVSSELTNKATSVSTHVCPSCIREGHYSDAKHCKFCGADLYPEL